MKNNKTAFKEKDLLRVGAFILDHLYENDDFIRGIANAIGGEWSHISKQCGLLEDNKLVVRSTKGRRVYLNLTKKGKEIAFSVKQIRISLKK